MSRRQVRRRVGQKQPDRAEAGEQRDLLGRKMHDQRQKKLSGVVWPKLKTRTNFVQWPAAESTREKEVLRRKRALNSFLNFENLSKIPPKSTHKEFKGYLFVSRDCADRQLKMLQAGVRRAEDVHQPKIRTVCWKKEKKNKKRIKVWKNNEIKYKTKKISLNKIHQE